jgi:hypothetical protein
MGGTGVFGKRLCRHLASFEEVELIVSSRTSGKAEVFVEELMANAQNLRVQGIALDNGKNLVTQLAVIRPFAVIDCSGPFQGANYDVARAILNAGAHLIDLADARDYLASFSLELDAIARLNGVSASTGASSSPTLSSSVVDEITRDWQRIDTIDICITPGGKSEVGQSVIEAIMSYAGKKIPMWQDGKLGQTTGWKGVSDVNMPNLGRRRVAAVETFDAESLGVRHGVQSRVSFSAGLESPIEQRGIEAIATLLKYNLFPNPKSLIPLLLKARQFTRIFSSDEGGMLVKVRGIDAAGHLMQTTWSLVAKNDHGPFIPILPAAATLQKLLKNDVSIGAYPANKNIILSDILAQMAPYDITSQTELSPAASSCFETYLGPKAFQTLPVGLQEFHSQACPPIWSGEADIARDRGLVLSFLGWLFGLPDIGVSVPLTVSVDRTFSKTGRSIERWTRTFGGKKMSSLLCHEADGSFVEIFSPFTFILALSSDECGIKMPVSGWKIGKIPLPKFLAPRSETAEFQDDLGRFRFDVRLTVPFFGLLAHYRGWLVPSLTKQS